MKIYDWLIVGGGLTGIVLAYELAKAGTNVVVIEQDQQFQNATRFSYGGLAYWAATTSVMQTLSQRGKAIHKQLPDELQAETEFRERDLLLLVTPDTDPKTVVNQYKRCHAVPEVLDIAAACKLEPLLNSQSIGGALRVTHGQINPEKTQRAYRKAFLRQGGHLLIDQVSDFVAHDQNVAGVTTLHNQKYFANNIVVCAGGLSRKMLQHQGYDVPLFFTHEQVILSKPIETQLNCLVMSANLNRYHLEQQVTRSDILKDWDQPDCELAASVMSAGAIQFQDSSLALGQLTRFWGNPTSIPDAKTSEQHIRQSIAMILPALANIPGTLHHCLVAFAPQAQPLIAQFQQPQNLFVFSGFTSPWVFVPPLAQDFVQWQRTGQMPESLNQLLKSL